MINLRLVLRPMMLVLMVCGFSLVASAQATRTWISGVGDDANPCSRTAPCKTFAGAIAKTAAAGEIDCLDPGGFGGLTITKAITIDCGPGVGSALVSGTNGFTVAAAQTDNVTIRNMTFEGLGTGLTGISILSASAVHIENVKIHNFTQFGVQVAASAAVNLSMTNVTITVDNTTGGGVSMTTTSGLATAEIGDVRIWGAQPALQGGANSVWTVHDSDLSYNKAGVKAIAAGATMNLINCQINNNSTNAVESFSGSTITLMGNTLTQNATALFPNSGSLMSDGQNNVSGNGSNGSPTGSTGKI